MKMAFGSSATSSSKTHQIQTAIAAQCTKKGATATLQCCTFLMQSLSKKAD